MCLTRYSMQGQGGEALDLLGVGDLDRPSPQASSVSWTSRAPVIDSTTAQTGSAVDLLDPPARAVLSDSASGGTASWSRCSPCLGEQADVDLASTQV